MTDAQHLQLGFANGLQGEKPAHKTMETCMRPDQHAPRRWLQLVVFGLLALPLLAQAGAWTPKEGASYNKFAVNSYDSDSFYGPAPQNFGKFTDRNATYYFEYGLRDDIAFYGSLPYKRLNNTDTNGARQRNTGVGDIDLGLRFRHVGGPTVVSTSWLFKAPYAYRENDPLALGNGQADLEFRVQLGRSLGKAGYLGAEAGLRKRYGAPADEFRYLLEYGGDIGSRLYARAKLDGIQGLGNSDSRSVTPGNPTLNLEFDLAKAELTGGVKLGQSLSAELTVTRDIYGNNTLRGTNYGLALVYAR